jgi:hypothetical protein
MTHKVEVAGQIVMSIFIVYMAWMLTSLVDAMHEDRKILFTIVERVTVLEETLKRE